MKFKEAQLITFATPISDSEDEQCKNAIRMVRDALKSIGFSDNGNDISRMYADSFSYQIRMRNTAGRDIKIFIQGSYANGTNIRSESDVDLAVVQENIFRTKYRSGVTDANYRFVSASAEPLSLKDEVENALIAKFGRYQVSRHNKSIHVDGNTYRKDADSVPCQRYRDYSNDFNNDPFNYIGGVVIKADDGSVVINYPEQHIKNGVEKNKSTSLRFKKIVRIAKNIRVKMEQQNIISAKKISSFLIESLLWNVPDEIYKRYSSYRFIFDDVVQYLFYNISNVIFFKEINGIKFISDDGIERIEICRSFITDIKSFFEIDLDE